MKKRLLILSLILISATPFFSRSAHAVENPLFSYTHLAPSPFTVPGGRIFYGTDLGFGAFDFFQLSTNLVRDFYGFYNAFAKVSLIDYPTFALGLNLGFDTYNIQTLDRTLPSVQITSIQPGVSVGFAIVPRVAVITALSFAIQQAQIPAGMTLSGYQRGTRLNVDVAWAYNPPKKKDPIGNVLSPGISYDMTYGFFGVGISHHWRNFQIGFHYYPQATTLPILPIISGGGSTQVN